MPMSSHPRGGRRALVGLSLLALLAAPAGAQSPPVLVSTTDDENLSGAPARDEDLVLHEAGLGARVLWPSETLSALSGPLTTSQHHVYGDVDALHDGGDDPLLGGLFFSLTANEAGFLDGDVLRLATDGGVTVFLAEESFIAAAGCTDGNVDVDAFHLDDDGRVLFSFAEDEASNAISGDTPGIIADGALLVWMPGLSTADFLYTASGVDALVAQALGSSANSGDLKSVARDPATGDVLFSVQSPTAHDGSVFTEAGGGALWPGHDEPSFGYPTEMELDALSIARRSWPGTLAMPPRPQPGDTVTVMLNGAEPGVPHVVLLAESLGPAQLPTLGWPGLVLAPDAVFATAVQLLAARTVVPNALGEGALQATLPPGAPAVDLFVQAVSLAGPPVCGNPFVVEVGQ